MEETQVFVYISDSCHECKRVVDLLDDIGLDYTLRNISKDKTHLKRLQEEHVYATPALFIKNKKILGYQERKIKMAASRL